MRIGISPNPLHSPDAYADFLRNAHNARSSGQAVTDGGFGLSGNPWTA